MRPTKEIILNSEISPYNVVYKEATARRAYGINEQIPTTYYYSKFDSEYGIKFKGELKLQKLRLAVN